ncbi:Oidioi.mRNA.OKI2018_I69.XSR.g13854.t1.cds [Oikopleura dioica]|uniref:Oidioi.mRNA.OKI2018_I69.XSR.g13854.t1.cds n=1 Tax=Oikopleura dioica TaxID=34765 RepID=A0ABN7SBW8_OIKDI|nr:Oidioi.mRNA.OKI2018_I69.XSR.g13854.t1.cds [Oikopleura dioica]
MTETKNHEDQEVFQGDIVSFTDENGKIVRGVVEVSGLDSESDILESMENAELPKDMVKIFTYPTHELVDKEMKDVKLLDRSLMVGDTVRRGKSGEIGTVVALEIESDLHGAYSKKGDDAFAVVTDVGNGDAEVNWVAYGHNEQAEMPKNEWYSSELWQLQAPWLEENIANTEGQGITLGARYKIKLTDEEAKSLNFLRNNPEAKEFNGSKDVQVWQSPEPLQTEKEVEISFNDVIELLWKITDQTEDETAPWIKIDFGKYSVITYEGESICKYDSKRGERVAEHISCLFEPIIFGKVDKEGTKQEVARRTEQVFAEVGKILGKQFEPDKLKIHMSQFTMESAGEGKWRKFRTIIKEDPNLKAALRGQGHSKYEFKKENCISVEVTDYFAKCKVMWQSGETGEYHSTQLFPALHINDHDFCPTDFVVREIRENLEEWGNVISVDFVEKQLVVQWHIDDQEKERETVSVFDVVDHPDYKFRLGELVVGTGTSDSNPAGVGMVQNILPSGKLEILWADRTESLVLPTHLISEYVLFGDGYDHDDDIDPEDYAELTDGEGDDCDSSDGSWESEDSDVAMDEERKLELDEELKGFINASAGPSEAKKIKSEEDLEARVLAYVYANGTEESCLEKIDKLEDIDEELKRIKQAKKEVKAEMAAENQRLEEKANEMIAEITEPASNDVPLDELGEGTD